MMRGSAAVARRDRGAIVVETALASVVLMMLITATMDFANMHYRRSTLQHAVSQATRFAITGNTVVDPNNSSKRLTRKDSITYLVKKISGIKDFGVDDIKIYVVASNGSLTEGIGNPGDVIMVRASYRIDLVTPGLKSLFPKGEYAFTCSTRFRNEEFTSAGVGLPDLSRRLA